MKKMVSLLLVIVMLMGMAAFVMAEGEQPRHDPEKVDELKQLKAELKTLMEEAKAQREVLKTKTDAVVEIRRGARQDKDWDTIGAIRGYRKSHLEMRIERLQLLRIELDLMDLVDEAKQAGDIDLSIDAVKQQIELAGELIDINNRMIQNMDDCLIEVGGEAA